LQALILSLSENEITARRTETGAYMHSVVHLLKSTTFPSVKRLNLETIQVNLGYLCNQSCTHCHVNAGPNRTELMQDEQIDQLITLMNQGWVKSLI
jgi:uncharacterized Fe-S cluster-containing radical SAM superfamily enzyme